MADQFSAVADDTAGTLRKVDESELTVGANTVVRQRVVIADDATAAAIAEVMNATPAAADYGLVTRPVTGDVVGSTAALNALNAAASVVLQGSVGGAMFLAAGTLIGTIVAEASYDGGTTWSAAQFVDPGSWTMSPSVVFASANPATVRSIASLAGATHLRVRVSVFTSGTANCTLRATQTDIAPFNKDARTNVGTQTIVASTVTVNTTILAANDARIGATIFNDSTATLFLLLSSATESATVWTVKVAPGGYFEVPFNYSGIIKGHWSAANGSARITEFT